MIVCAVCENKIDFPIYNSINNISVTSSSEIYSGYTIVYFCEQCGHLQTPEIENVDEYYDKSYKVLIESDEEDQLYQIKDNRNIFRYDYQAQVLLDLIDIPKNAKILDYGCAKGTTIKKIFQERADIKPYFFDITDIYIPFWKKLVSEEQFSTYKINSTWKGQFDLVTSFFSLEHAKDPKHMVSEVWDLLKNDGFFYFIVPNPLKNIADSIVVDHVNHFSNASINYLLNSHGFTDVVIYDDLHINAFVVKAKKTNKKIEIKNNFESINFLSKKFTEIATYWTEFSERVSIFEQEHSNVNNVAIYGSGFYGAFITSCLKNQEKVSCYLDQSPFKQGKTLFDKPIISPDKLDEKIDIVYVALNPLIAKTEIDKIEYFKGKNKIYFLP